MAREPRPRLIALFLALLSLSACGRSPEVEPEPTAQAPPTPTPRQTVEVVGEADVLDTKLQIRVLAPASGQPQAEAAIAQAMAETERVAGLPADSRELAATKAPRPRSRPRARAATRPPRLPYAVDRASDVLVREGMTDFLVTSEPTFRARGSQDGSTGRGWRVGLPGPEEPSGAPPSRVLRDEALHWTGDGGAGWLAVGPRASEAARSADRAAAGKLPLGGYEVTALPAGTKSP